MARVMMIMRMAGTTRAKRMCTSMMAVVMMAMMMPVVRGGSGRRLRCQDTHDHDDHAAGARDAGVVARRGAPLHARPCVIFGARGVRARPMDFEQALAELPLASGDDEDDQPEAECVRAANFLMEGMENLPGLANAPPRA
eukprot:7851-Karenia_brevis.AAC.1